jgi:hypothetical protein
MRKEKIRQRRTKKDKVDKFVMGALKKKERRVLGPLFNSKLVRNGLVINLVAVPIGLVVNLVSRFWKHGGTNESNYFLE